MEHTAFRTADLYRDAVVIQTVPQADMESSAHSADAQPSGSYHGLDADDGPEGHQHARSSWQGAGCWITSSFYRRQSRKGPAHTPLCVCVCVCWGGGGGRAVYVFLSLEVRAGVCHQMNFISTVPVQGSSCEGSNASLCNGTCNVHRRP